VPITREGANLLFQLCSALYERVAMIITSNLSFSEWKSVLGEEHLTAALLDRLTHRAHILEFVGESFRFRQRLKQQEHPEEEVVEAERV
jgi:DNA replication protein DnaC